MAGSSGGSGDSGGGGGKNRARFQQLDKQRLQDDREHDGGIPATADGADVDVERGVEVGGRAREGQGERVEVREGEGEEKVGFRAVGVGNGHVNVNVSTHDSSFASSHDTGSSELGWSAKGDSFNSSSSREGMPSSSMSSPSSLPSMSSGRVRQFFTDRRDYDPTQETHYVLVVHGTFDAPPPGLKPTPWYWLDVHSATNFCATLNHDLKRSHLGEHAMWRPLPSRAVLPEECQYPFYWDGSNTHVARINAGKNLAMLIHTIGKADPSARVHVVAHSHGGNVVLKALSKYLTLLRKDANKNYSDAVTNAFWEANAQGYKDIRQHQAPTGLSWWTAMVGLFVVVRRPWAQDPTLGMFPWGCWEITDRLLGLPKVRQAKYLRKKWATSTNTNCLGHIVFMGTPFYSKYWDPHAWLYMLLNIIIMTGVVMIVVVGAVVVFKLITTHQVSSANLTTWEITFWWVAAVVSLALVAYNTVRDKRYSDGNLYFTEKKGWSPAMRALVLNAGKLDEAALALSTEPLVRAYLMPQIKTMLTPDPWRAMKPFPSKRGWLTSAANLYNNLWIVLWNIVLALPYLVLYLLNFVLVPYFSNQLLKLFITLGFGLQKGELDNARVYVEEILRLDEDTHTITHWNVQKILTAAALDALEELKMKAPEADEVGVTLEALEETKPHEEDPRAVAERWRFLWDEVELDRKAKESHTLDLLREQMGSMQYNPKTSRMAFERELKLICVTLEERYKDMTGNVELSHGSYFRNKVIIAAISFFLIHGSLPAWAPQLGDVLDQRHLGTHPHQDGVLRRALNRVMTRKVS